MQPDIPIPRSFLESPRWWTDGSRWLADLPRIAREQCGRWGLTVTGRPSHGSNALVLPVHRGRAPFVLRLRPPGPDVGAQIAALRFWDGRGTVHLIHAITADFDTAVTAAGIDRDHGRNWVLYRTADYWLWGLAAGLTEDPERCRRLVSAFAG